MAGEKKYLNWLLYEKTAYEAAHPAYGLVKEYYERNTVLLALIPFNILFRLVYLFYAWIRFWPKRTLMEREIHKYYQWKRGKTFSQKVE